MAKRPTRLLRYIHIVAMALALTFTVALIAPLPAAAQTDPQGNTNEQQLLDALKPGGAISGQVTIPDKKSANLIHPAGREWREFRTVILKWIGGVAILGVIALLAVFYFWRGSMTLHEGRSGIPVQRFKAFERFVHWLTASSFIVLAITGLNFTFGRSLLLPLIGPEAFSTWSELAKYAHNYISFAFTIGVLLIFVVWIPRNLPTWADFEWMKQGGGMFGGAEPPASKFNAGEKLIFWLVVVAGLSVSVSGYVLLLPFVGTDISSMELTQIAHSTIAVLFIAAICVHIYMGTLGMEGAFEGMVTGNVDLNWAKEHHSLWYEEEIAPQATRPAE